MTEPASYRTSFLLPVRNGAATLDQALQSVGEQTDPDFEVVIVDDGSTDESFAIATSWPDPRFRVLQQPPKGLVSALNYGLSQCRGEFIARMDADDLALPERLELQLPILDDPTIGAVDGQVQFFRDQGHVPAGMRHYESWVNQVLSPRDFDRELLVESPIVHPAVTFRKSVVQDLGGYRDGDFPEDYDLWLRLHAAGYQLRKVERLLVRMRDRPQRLTRTDDRYRRDAFRGLRQWWLKQTVMAQPRRVALWGAGKQCRPWMRWLVDNKHNVVAIIDIDPAKIGKTRRGTPITLPEDLPRLEIDICLVAVGARGARPIIRQALRELRPDWEEGRDWWAVC
ncbi:MAG: glycosyltransferase [Proteobacteria bacterium]|jgi:cellulose synthase/poly-beta-1,6-N-acetylglucosamine synthase-like glycosyltransferase|nr:glycosyltransferase [Pseudomonadota bacterium]